jgi:poly-gamma-glutamate capsule biosynthesis protein CapA/YwtB (metallophosphatase superfamily)
VGHHGPGHQAAGRRVSAASAVSLVAVCLVVFGLVVAVRAIRPAQRPTLAPAPAGAVAAPTRRQARPPPPAAQITLAFAGDVHFEGRVDQRLTADPASTLGPISAVLSRADLAMVNLETSITERGTPEPKEFYFRAPAAAFTALRSAGVDVATMANNHAVDFGPVGLRDTLAAIESTRFPVVGVGDDAAHAYAPWITTVRGHRVAILAASQIRDHTLAAWTATETSPGIASAYSDRLVAAVRDARRLAEVVVVYVHWGEEGNSCPIAAQRDLARRLAAAGADAVVGTHAHLLLGGGWLGPTYVAYGLGNFLWWRDNAYSNDTGVLTLTFRGRRAVAATLEPAEIDEHGVPLPATGGQGSRILAKWDRVRGCADLAAAPG